MKVSGSCAAVAALAATANARHLVRSEPTVAVSLADNGVSPRPTTAPDYDLLRRAASDTGTLLYAPDNTCGFISGLEGAGYTCFGTYTCAFTISSDEGHVGCCEAGVCNYRYSCVDYDGYYSSSQCDDGCKVDVLTLKCTDTAAPYCNTISFSGGVSDYWCNSLGISTAQMANTTYSGGDARVYTTLDETSTTESSSSESTTSASSTVQSDSTSTGATASASTSSDSDGGGGSSTPVGPIVGGVVGGVAALALAGAAIFFCLRSKKKKETAAASTATNTTPPAYQAPNMQQQPGVGPNGYNPVPQGQAGYYDPKQAYSTPNQQYNQTAYYPTHNQPGSPDFSQTNPSSPGTFVDPRMAQSSTSPSPSYNQQIPGQQPGYQPGYQPQQAVIHEAPSNPVGSNGRGDTHELA